ncbi:hypothetical protein EC950183_3499, partial [Escherichia coli 95.0183]
KYTFIVIIL